MSRHGAGEVSELPVPGSVATKAAPRVGGEGSIERRSRPAWGWLEIIDGAYVTGLEVILIHRGGPQSVLYLSVSCRRLLQERRQIH